MLAFLANPLTRAMGVLVVVALVVGGAYTYGKAVGRQGAAVEALQRSIEVLRERNQTDDEVYASDAADLCGSMGLSEQDRVECVRRLVEADAEPGNVSNSSQD